ncbi:unnamed protein product [Mytilus coruscus]|uniref:Uncharacterized protein n=1 Tax=Mytilus coruscus TaxID=42192 RepID=A0A6J8DYU6_MYTCO|nr:unnamed protein product [Mytilus coruscus]
MHFRILNSQTDEALYFNILTQTNRKGLRFYNQTREVYDLTHKPFVSDCLKIIMEYFGERMGDIDCGDCDCGDCDCGDCDCGDCNCDCGDCKCDCCDDCCKIFTCNGCTCDCCDGDSNGCGGCYPAYFCCVTSDWDCCNNSRSGSYNATTNQQGRYTNTSRNETNQNGRNEESEQNGAVTTQPPSYEEAVLMNPPVTEQPVSQI